MISVPYELAHSIFPAWATCRCCGLELPLELFPPEGNRRAAICTACTRDCGDGVCRLGILHN